MPGPGGVPGPRGCLVPRGVSGSGAYLVPEGWRYSALQDGYCCGRYASYWNAFLCDIKLYCNFLFFFEQKEIHRSDGSTLEDHRITDGSAINVMTKPEQFIVINVKCGPKTYTKNVSNSLTVGQLKGQLVNTGVVAFLIDEFKLRKFLN